MARMLNVLIVFGWFTHSVCFAQQGSTAERCVVWLVQGALAGSKWMSAVSEYTANFQVQVKPALTVGSGFEQAIAKKFQENQGAPGLPTGLLQPLIEEAASQLEEPAREIFLEAVDNVQQDWYGRRFDEVVAIIRWEKRIEKPRIYLDKEFEENQDFGLEQIMLAHEFGHLFDLLLRWQSSDGKSLVSLIFDLKHGPKREAEWFANSFEYEIVSRIPKKVRLQLMAWLSSELRELEWFVKEEGELTHYTSLLQERIRQAVLQPNGCSPRAGWLLGDRLSGALHRKGIMFLFWYQALGLADAGRDVYVTRVTHGRGYGFWHDWLNQVGNFEG